MTIAITANSAWNLLNFRKSLILTLKNEGHNLIAVAPHDDAVEKLIEETGVKFVPLNSLSRKGSNPIEDLKLIQEYKNIYKNNKIDVAIQYTIKPNIYGSLAGGRSTKTISNLTGLGYVFMKKSLTNLIAKRLYKMALKKTSYACFHNQIDAQLFKDLNLVSNQKAVVINGSGVDTDYFKATHRTENEKFIFLFVGRLLFDKGIRELLMAYKKLHKQNQKIELHILGDIDSGNPASLSSEDLNHYITELNLVHHGMQTDVKGYINQSDCVVLPSYREGLPKSLLEAMSMERPFITVNSVGCKHLVEDDKNGLLAKVKSSESLFEAMKKMLNLSKQQRAQMGSAGRQIVLEKYSTEIINNEYIKLISQLNV